jgi:hypothetical protein
MRKEFNVRIRLRESLGREIHLLSLKENRSQSATVSWLVTQALDAIRARAAEEQELMRAGSVAKVSKIVAMLKGEPSA